MKVIFHRPNIGFLRAGPISQRRIKFIISYKKFLYYLFLQ